MYAGQASVELTTRGRISNEAREKEGGEGVTRRERGLSDTEREG